MNLISINKKEIKEWKTMKKTKNNISNAWIMRPKPHGTDQMDYFLKKNRICIGYPVGQSLKGCNYNDLRRILTEEDLKNQKNGKSSKLINGLSNVNILVRDMKVGDIVVVPHGNDIYFANITSDYVYENVFDKDKLGSGFPHQREVEWLFDGKPLSRNELPTEIRESLQFPGTAANIKKHVDVLNNLLNGADLIQNNFELNNVQDNALKVAELVLNAPDSTTDQRLKAAELILNYGKIK